MDPRLEQRIEHWLRKLNLAIALPVVAGVVFLVAWNRGVALLYGLVALLVGTVLIARVAPRYNLAGVVAKRGIPPAAHEGETVTLELELSAAGLRPRYMLEVTDHLPFAEEGQRSPMVFIDRVDGNVKVHVAVRCDLRGEHTLGPLQLHSAYPLGVHRAQHILAGSQCKILVYPQPFPIRSLPLVGASQSPIVGAQAASVAGSHEDFFGVREYRPGDSHRHVHWAATARRGKLIVKEFEYMKSTDLVIVLDLDQDSQHGNGKHSTLEYAVKTAASVARYALANGHRVGLVGFGAQRIEVPTGCGMRHYHAVLDVLARVQGDGKTPYHEAIRVAAGYLPCGGVLFLFEHGPLQRRTGEKQQMFSHHIKPIRVRFDIPSFDDPQGGVSPPRPTSLSGHHYLVRKGDDLAQVFS